MKTIFSLLVVLLFVVSCGGGDSVESPTVPEGSSEPETMEPVEPDPIEPGEPTEPMEPEVPEEPMEPEVPEMPVTPDPVEPDPEPEVPEVPETVDLQIPEWMPTGIFGVEECVNTDDLLYFFNEVFQGETRIERFNERPELSLAEGTTDFQADIVRRALEYINASLPRQLQGRDEKYTCT